MSTPGTVVGRDRELAAIERFLDDAAGGPAALLFEGAAGIGKTTVWEAALAAAARRERRLLVARGAGAEVRLAYAGLADLLADVGEQTLAALPGPQRTALRLALLRDDDPGDGGGDAGGGDTDADGDGRDGAASASASASAASAVDARVSGGARPDPRAIATGLRSVLELLAAERPLVLAIDDLHWLDPSSLAALRFAVRRVSGPIGVLATVRTDERGADAAAGFELREHRRPLRLAIEPLAAPELRRILAAEARRPLPPSLLARVVETAAGNPFIALELARTVEQVEHEPAPLSQLPGSLRELVDARLTALSDREREAVTYAALLTRPDVPRVQRALGAPDAAALLGAAEAAGILRLDGARIVFAHPLLATGAYAALEAPARRAAHRTIAAVTAGEERARHLALAATGAEPAVIAALDAAAAQARGRGSAAAAAELLELALRLGADDAPRRQLAAEHHLDAGAFDRARELLDGLAAELPAGGARAAALARLATIRLLADDFPAAIPLLEQAIAESGEERPAVELALVFARTHAGGLREAVPLATATRERAERRGEPDGLAQALAVEAMVGFLSGEGVEEERLRRALALERPDRGGPAMMRPSLIAGLIWLWTGRLDEARAAIGRARRHCRERGEESELALATMHLGLLACLVGDLDFGREMVAEGLGQADQIGSPTSRAFALENQVHVAGWVGDVELARRAGAEAVATHEASGSSVGLMFANGALGRLELALGDHAAAAERLVPAAQAALEMGSGEPGIVYWTADAVEALTALGRRAEAEPIRRWQRERSEALGRPELLAVAARLDGLALAAGGELERADELLAEALARQQQAPSAYAEARTLLVRGQVQRRLRRRAAARASFAHAAERFDALGAVLWTGRARQELERLDGSRDGGAELTAAEVRVAARAAAGMTNRAAAAELFVSPKTIEATLTRVYRKLGIHTRAELGRWMAERER